MTVIARSRFRLPALLLMLTVAGCAMQRPSPEEAAPDSMRLTTPETQPGQHQQIVLQMAMGAHSEAYLVWMRAGREEKDWTFLFSRSEDGGATWSGPLWSRKPEQGMFIEAIKLATGSKGQVYLAWRERNAEKTDTRVLMTRSLDGGKHWDETPRQLAAGDHLGPPYLQPGPDEVLYVAWLGGDESRRVLEVATSLDSGGTFTPTPIQPALAESDRGINNPRLAADEKGRLYVAWEEGTKGSRRRAGIYLSRSEDQGRTWSEPILVSRLGADSRGAHVPEIAAASDGQVYLIWEQSVERTVKIEGRRRPVWPIDRLVYFNRSLDGGRTWLSEPIRLGQPNPMSLNRLRSTGTQVVADGRGHVYAAFIEAEGTELWRLVVRHSADSGATWEAPTELSRTSRVKGRPITAVLAYGGEGRLWLVWQEHAFGPRYGWFVLMNRSEDHGRKWAKQSVIIGEPTVGQTTDRDVLVGVGENSLILTAWDHGARVYQPIALNRSVDGGKSWSSSRLPLD
ncbi:MAG TPA: sialidase family protein [Verrucomicrobiae bacterium]|nr:sialidase family protein [Verrucomicrobiae bacterium]